MRKKKNPSYTPAPGKKFKEITKSELVELQNYWYEKLDETGFEDLEPRSSEEFGAQDNPIYIKTAYWLQTKYKPGKAEYFSYCSDYVHEGKFDSLLHKYLFSRYANGLSYRKILNWYNKETKWGKKEPRSIFWLFTIIKKYEREVYKKYNITNQDPEEPK